ncbi:riboflavin kinase [Thrips palmi]|uniref:Riboflavin kinase n=1 Tax=Thrips palmi TaxID=161013 RepID=A0A6P9AB99_THRPL|nr:riboflavin kinase [Thrips palmi]
MTFSKGLPHFASGIVVKGFGRGSKELGIPTANFEPHIVKELPEEVGTGIYFGWAQIDEGTVHKMVMSVGWNPYFKNVEKSMETHILTKFSQDFYGRNLRVCMVGYLRPEKDFTSLDALVKQIYEDISVAEKELEEPVYLKLKSHKFFCTDKDDVKS